MPVAVTCASCSRPLRVPEAVLGQLVRCPLCNDTFIAEAVPEAVESVPEAPPPEPAPAEEAPPPMAPRPVRAVDSDEDEPPRRRPREADARRPPALRFTAVVPSDPEGAFEGAWDAEVTRDGLLLRRGETELLVPVGGPARHLGGNRLEVRVEGREVLLQVRRPRTHLTRLARDLASFLDGQSPRPRAAEYGLPWLLYLTPALVLGVPLLGLATRLLGGGWVGGLIWGGLTAFFAALCWLAVTRGTWDPLGRLFAVGALLTVAYGALFCAFVYELIVPPTTFAASDWKTFAPPGGNYRVRMPGTPKSEPQF